MFVPQAWVWTVDIVKCRMQLLVWDSVYIEAVCFQQIDWAQYWIRCATICAESRVFQTDLAPEAFVPSITHWNILDKVLNLLDFPEVVYINQILVLWFRSIHYDSAQSDIFLQLKWLFQWCIAVVLVEWEEPLRTQNLICLLRDRICLIHEVLECRHVHLIVPFTCCNEVHDQHYEGIHQDKWTRLHDHRLCDRNWSAHQFNVLPE